MNFVRIVFVLIITFLRLSPHTSIGHCQSNALENFLPRYSPKDQIIRHFAYTLKYNEQHEQAEWVIYFLTKERASGSIERTDNFRLDPEVKTGSASLDDYKGSGYDRGHLAPAGDMTWSKIAMSESFFMSNMSPQEPSFNQGIWRNLESLVRSWAVDNNEIYVVTGPALKGDLPTIGLNKVAVPEFYYKVILDYQEPELKGIGFILPNQSSTLVLQTYAVNIDSVESFTGIDFFPAIPDSMENIIESSLKLDKWSFTVSRSELPEKSTTKSVQCKGITKNGTRCKRMTTNENGYCWQHQDQAKVIGQQDKPNIKSDSQDIIVYITKTGNRYHREGCSSLSKSKIPIPLKEAKTRGYGPCSRCKPPQ